jgi:hypothetical protein
VTAHEATVRRIRERVEQQHGTRADLSAVLACEPALLAEYGTGRRVQVCRHYASGPHVRTGLVGMSTGWRPVLLLIHRRTDSGSGDVLGPGDRLLAVQHDPGGPYVSVTTATETTRTEATP